MSSNGRQGHARDSKEPGPFRILDRSLGATDTLGTSRQQHGQWPRPARPRTRRCRCSRIGPTESLPASCRPFLRDRKVSSEISSLPSGIGPIPRHISTMRSRRTSAIPRVNANGEIYGCRGTQHGLSASPRPGGRSGEHGEIAQFVIRRRHPAQTTKWLHLRLTGATTRSGTANPMFTIRCSMRKGGCGLPRESAAVKIRHSAKKARAIPRQSLFPLKTSGRQLAVYDQKTKKVTLIDTCFGTHHLVFAEDGNNTLWTSSGGGGGAVGWLNTKLFDETHDEEKSQGWTALILDTNGNGKRDEYVEPDQPIDPKKDKRINAAFYGVTVSPVDSSIWGTVLGFPGAVVRLNPGANPPATALAEIFELPWNNPNAPVPGFSPRGLDIDRHGVVWTVIASGHLTSFDRRKCKGPLNGPTATGQHCPEGWTLYQLPGPQLKGVTDPGSAESSYYDWVDQFDTFGPREERADRHRQRK